MTCAPTLKTLSHHGSDSKGPRKDRALVQSVSARFLFAVCLLRWRQEIKNTRKCCWAVCLFACFSTLLCCPSSSDFKLFWNNSSSHSQGDLCLGGLSWDLSSLLVRPRVKTLPTPGKSARLNPEACQCQSAAVWTKSWPQNQKWVQRKL